MVKVLYPLYLLTWTLFPIQTLINLRIKIMKSFLEEVNLPSAGGAAPSSGGAAPSVGGTVPSAVGAAPSADDDAPSTGAPAGGADPSRLASPSTINHQEQLFV